MFKNYLKVAFRNIWRHKVYSLINIFGLSIGIALCILVLVYVQDELSYDSFHENAGRIYRIAQLEDHDGELMHYMRIGPGITEKMKIDFPDSVEKTGNITYLYIFSVIAFVVLLVACINFMNLSTARSANRAREVGMRKVVGAVRQQLIKQFIGKSMFITFLALPLAYYVLHQWLQDFHYRISIRIEVFLFSTVLILVIAFLSISYQSVKAALADPIDALRYE